MPAMAPAGKPVSGTAPLCEPSATPPAAADMLTDGCGMLDGEMVSILSGEDAATERDDWVDGAACVDDADLVVKTVVVAGALLPVEVGVVVLSSVSLVMVITMGPVRVKPS